MYHLHSCTYLQFKYLRTQYSRSSPDLGSTSIFPNVLLRRLQWSESICMLSICGLSICMISICRISICYNPHQRWSARIASSAKPTVTPPPEHLFECQSEIVPSREFSLCVNQFVHPVEFFILLVTPT